MTVNDLESVNLADAELLSVVAKRGSLRIEIKDWREIRFWLVFRDVLGFEANLPGSGDLSHGYEDSADPFLGNAKRMAGEQSSEYRCFSIVEVDEDRRSVKVVAKGVSVVAGDAFGSPE